MIAIIAILAAILFPVFAQAREKARQTACLSNCKQLGVGVMLYVQDYDETFPLGGWNGANGTFSRWYLDVAPYIKNTVIRNCPSNPFEVDAVQDRGTNYGINIAVSAFPNVPVTALADLTAPAGLVLFCDTAQLRPQVHDSPDHLDPQKWLPWAGLRTDWQVQGPYIFNNNNFPYTVPPDPFGNRLRRPIPLHNGGANVGFADGHAKWYRNDQLVGPMPRGWPLGDPRNLWDNQ